MMWVGGVSETEAQLRGEREKMGPSVRTRSQVTAARRLPHPKCCNSQGSQAYTALNNPGKPEAPLMPSANSSSAEQQKGSTYNRWGICESRRRANENSCLGI